MIPQRKEAAYHLALALHSLQDSFSLAHTKRTLLQEPSFLASIEDIYLFRARSRNT